MHPVLKRNCEVFSACDWLAALTAHIPNAGEHLVRYDGWYSNMSRGEALEGPGRGPYHHRGIPRDPRFHREGRLGAPRQAGGRGRSPRPPALSRSHAHSRLHRTAQGHREDPDPPRSVLHARTQSARIHRRVITRSIRPSPSALTRRDGRPVGLGVRPAPIRRRGLSARVALACGGQDGSRPGCGADGGLIVAHRRKGHSHYSHLLKDQTQCV